MEKSIEMRVIFHTGDPAVASTLPVLTCFSRLFVNHRLHRVLAWKFGSRYDDFNDRWVTSAMAISLDTILVGCAQVQNTAAMDALFREVFDPEAPRDRHNPDYRKAPYE